VETPGGTGWQGEEPLETGQEISEEREAERLAREAAEEAEEGEVPETSVPEEDAEW
jgi:hypothetical protein